MSKFTIKVSQRIYYDVEIEAPSAVEALREAARCIDPNETTPGPDLDDFQMVEIDSDGFKIEAVQAGVVNNPAFIAELTKLIKARVIDEVIIAAANARAFVI